MSPGLKTSRTWTVKMWGERCWRERGKSWSSRRISPMQTNKQVSVCSLSLVRFHSCSTASRHASRDTQLKSRSEDLGEKWGRGERRTSREKMFHNLELDWHRMSRKTRSCDHMEDRGRVGCCKRLRWCTHIAVTLNTRDKIYPPLPLNCSSWSKVWIHPPAIRAKVITSRLSIKVIPEINRTPFPFRLSTKHVNFSNDSLWLRSTTHLIKSSLTLMVFLKKKWSLSVERFNLKSMCAFPKRWELNPRISLSDYINQLIKFVFLRYYS